MLQHELTIGWDVSKNLAELYILSVIKVMGLIEPITINVTAPSWTHKFTFN